LDGDALAKAAQSDAGQALLDEDFALAGSLGERGLPTILMVNEEKKAVKLVGARTLDDYVNALEQVVPDQALQVQPIPALSQLLEKERLLFSKEIEVMYSLEADQARNYIRDALPAGTYGGEEILGEYYVTKKQA